QKESGFLEKQLASISLQQAQKDYNTAEFYRRTGHPGAAFFSYEIVRRRYPGTKLADLAAERMEEVRAAAEREQGRPRNPLEKTADAWNQLWGKGPKPGADGPEADMPVVPPPGPAAAPKPLPADMVPR